MSETRSTYYFIGKLSPEEFCTKFNPGEIYLGNDLVLDIFQEGVSIWIPGIEGKFDDIKALVMEAFDININTFMFITNLKLNFSLHSWVEAKNTVARSNIIGWIIPPGAKRPSPNKKSRYSATWRKVSKYYLNIKNSFYHKLILNDYKSCINSLGDDGFFYAYRIVEDIRRATTINLPNGLDKDRYWQAMHKKLGTSKSMINPLTKVAEKVRHGAINDPIVIKAREHRQRIINIALDIMKKEFKLRFKGLIK